MVCYIGFLCLRKFSFKPTTFNALIFFPYRAYHDQRKQGCLLFLHFYFKAVDLEVLEVVRLFTYILFHYNHILTREKNITCEYFTILIIFDETCENGC